MLSIPFVFSQQGDHVDGGEYLKRQEYNLGMGGACNLDSKSDIEKQFFGFLNSPVEFFFAASVDVATESPRGFRIMKDTLDQKTYIIEVIRIIDKEKNIKRNSFTISDQFALLMHQKMVSIIQNFRGSGKPPLIMHGYRVTFRNVVKDEVWSLKIHEPQGRALKLTELCRQIIYDACNTKLNEQRYIKILNEL